MISNTNTPLQLKLEIDLGHVWIDLF